MKTKFQQRRYILTVACFLLPLITYANVAISQSAVVHAIIIGDVSPAAGWGELTKHITSDTTGMYATLVNGLPESQFRYYPLLLEDNEAACPKNVLAYLNEVSVQPQDTLLVYYSGHGAADDMGHFFQLAGGKLYRDELRRAMAIKSARLNVLLSDCCNLREDGHSYFSPYIMESPPRQPTAILNSLLLQPAGWVDVNASAPGEGAFFGIDDPESGGMPGSLFTTALLALWENQSGIATTWDQLVAQVRVDVYLAFRQNYPKGVAAEAGFEPQLQQNVYAYSYPGMPRQSGPRTGLIVRDHDQAGALIVRIDRESPASRVFNVAEQRFVALQPGQNIVMANDQPIQEVQDLVGAVDESPQLLRLTIESDSNAATEYLMSLRY